MLKVGFQIGETEITLIEIDDFKPEVRELESLVAARRAGDEWTDRQSRSTRSSDDLPRLDL